MTHFSALVAPIIADLVVNAGTPRPYRASSAPHSGHDIWALSTARFLIKVTPGAARARLHTF